MEVKPGYKQTEVGVIPENWRVVTLGDICVFENGDRSSNYPSPGDFAVSGVPFVNAGHISEGRIDIATMDYIKPEIYARLTRGKLKEGDILYCLRGSLGKFGIVPSDFGNGAIASSLAIVRPKSATVTRQYLLCYFGSTICKQMIETWSGGAAQPNLGVQDLFRFLVPLPPTHNEQVAIAETLSDADAYIESLEQLISKKQQIKQGAMQELLTGNRRLPGFEGEWEVKRLGDIAHIKTGSRNNQDKEEDGNYPFFVRSATIERINSYSYDCEAILIPGEGGIGSIFHYINGRFDVHQRVYGITGFNPDVSGKYVYFYMTLNFGAHAMENSVKATVDSLRLPTFQNFEISVPPTIKEQAEIVNLLTTMEEELASAEAKRIKANQLKEGLMQELLTGRTRLL